MSEKQAKKLRELDKRLRKVEKFMVRLLRLVNDSAAPQDAKDAIIGADISEYSDDVEDFDEP